MPPLLVHLYHVTGEGHKGVKQSCVQLDQSLRLVDDAHSRLKVWSIHDSQRNCHFVAKPHPDCLLHVSEETCRPQGKLISCRLLHLLSHKLLQETAHREHLDAKNFELTSLHLEIGVKTMEGSVQSYVESEHQMWSLHPIGNMDKVSQNWVGGCPPYLQPH